MPIQDLFVAQIARNTPDVFNLSPGTYDYSNFVFPSNLGASHLGHYMIININIPTGKDDKSAGRTYSGFDTTPNNDKSKLDKLREKELNTYTPGTTAGNLIDEVGTVLNDGLNEVGLPSAPIDRIAIGNRHTRRIKDTVVLAMPQNNLIYTSENDFENIALAHYGISGLAGAVAAGIGAFSAEAGVRAYSVMNAAGKAISKASTVAGYPLNPRLEILFTGRRQRGFVFEILMSPVNVEEANLIQNIIRLLRFHSSPDISASSYFFVPPAEFDISFYKDGKENLNIPRINTCVLEKIEVDMAPTGSYAAFSTGHPVQTRLSLGFREIEILHKARITQGF